MVSLSRVSDVNNGHECARYANARRNSMQNVALVVPDHEGLRSREGWKCQLASFWAIYG